MLFWISTHVVEKIIENKSSKLFYTCLSCKYVQVYFHDDNYVIMQ